MRQINVVKNLIGIDIGGTTIKGAIINHNGEILREASIKTSAKGDGEGLRNNVVALVNELVMGFGGFKSSFSGIGIGCPGLIDSGRGIIVFSGNLGLSYYPLGSSVSESLCMPVKVTNDANAAALGEAKFGAGKKYKNSVLVTLGTGIGGGIIVDGKLFEGGKSAGTEIGHTVIEKNGYPCTCGRKGCFECYASATALVRKTKEVMKSNKNSGMWKKYNLDTVCGKTAFDYFDTDEAAKSIINWYLEYLACGLTNIANVFRPDVIMLGGGISGQGEKLTKPLQELLNKELFAGSDYAPVKVVKASLGNYAGALGAAALNM